MKLTFVCLGNICRSPMAEFIFKNLLASSDLENVRVDSAATSYEEVGNPIYPPARSALTAHAVPYDASKRARRLTKSDYASTDLFVCMEERNRRDCLRIFGGDPEGKSSVFSTLPSSNVTLPTPITQATSKRPIA